MSKVLLLGGSGMLGTDLKTSLAAWVGSDKLLCPSRAELDVTDPAKVFRYFLASSPSCVINATAYTNVDKAETETDLARALNVRAPKALAQAAAELKVPFVHFSTDQVFSGEGDRPWQEEDAPSPLNAYAQTKLAGEEEVLGYAQAIVLRVQWLYGRSKDRFSPLRTKEVFTPFVDQIGAPTATKLIASMVPQFLERQLSGLFHFAHDDFASWFDVYSFVKDHWALPTRLEPRRTADVALPAKRPLNSRLSNRKLCAALGISGLGSWKEPLRDFLRDTSSDLRGAN